MHEHGWAEPYSRRHVEFALRVTESFLWAVDVDTGRLVTHLGSAESLFDVSIEDVGSVESLHERVVHPDDRPAIEHASKQVLRGEKSQFDVEFRTHPEKGDVRWITLHGRILSNEKSDVLAGIATDVTDRERYEREIQRQNERLEEFATVLSHDFRNPLEVAFGHLELVGEERGGEHLDAIDRSLKRMDSLLEDILKSIEKGTPIIRGGESAQGNHVVELETVAEHCWENVETEKATLQVDTDSTVRADRRSLRRLFENLLDNAIEHAGPDVTVTVDDIEDATGFYVADDGPGIPDAEHDRVFEADYSTSEEGIGLGLHIVEGVADAHDWKISVTDSESGGARFELTGVDTTA